MANSNSAKQIDLLNIGLVIISFVLAVNLPFELFIFSYAFLGPLHYLTEIQWLQKRDFFIAQGRNWHWIMTGGCLVLSIAALALFIWPGEGVLQESMSFIDANAKVFILTFFLFCVGFLFLKSKWKLLGWFVFSALASVAATHLLPKSILYMGIFLPTIIHVYLFTVLFILFGSMKSKSRYGYLTAFLFLLLPLVFPFVKVDVMGISLNSAEAIDTVVAGNFAGVGASLASILGLIENGQYSLTSGLAIRIQMFIAFAYTYHYLNWFSKTSIIGWRKALNPKSLGLVLGLWTLAVAIYLYDFKTGFMALFFLSLLHVFLEFPLNAITIKEVFSAPFRGRRETS